MSRLRITFLAAAVLLLSATGAFAANGISVQGAAAQNGTSFGLQVNLDGSTNLAYVLSEHPVAESHYLLRFWLQPATMLNLGLDTAVRIGQISDETAGAIVVVFLRHDDPAAGGDTYRINTWVKEDSGTFRFGGGHFLSFDNNPTPRQIEIEWTQATAPGANNGALTVTRVGGPTSTISDIDNDTHAVDRAFWGIMAPGGANMTGAGSFYFDEYESYR
jgi:hypothetical protein